MQRMHLGHRVFVILVGLVVASGLAAPAPAQAATPTTLTMSGAKEHADQDTRLELDLLHEDGSPVVGAQVLVERRTGGDWGQLGLVTTDELGHAELAATMARRAEDNVFRASYAGDPATAPAETGPVPVKLIRRSTRLVVSGPDRGRRREVGAGPGPLGHGQRRPGAGHGRASSAATARVTGRSSARCAPATTAGRRSP